MIAARDLPRSRIAAKLRATQARDAAHRRWEGVRRYLLLASSMREGAKRLALGSVDEMLHVALSPKRLPAKKNYVLPLSARPDWWSYC